MFAALQSVSKSLKSGLFHLTGQLNTQRGRATVQDGMILVFKFLVAISVD